MVKDSTDHGQAMCRWFAHPLGACKSTHPLNGLSRLETRHSGPSLGLIHPESNWSNFENTVDALQVQLDLNTFAICNLESKNYGMVFGLIYVPKIIKKGKTYNKKIHKSFIKKKTCKYRNLCNIEEMC